MKNTIHNLFYCFCLLCCVSLTAQTTLGPGDMAITEMKHTSTLDNNGDRLQVSLVLLKDCVAGTKFVITDREIVGGVIRTRNSFNNLPSEGVVEITFDAAAACGSELTIFTLRRLNQDAIVTVSGDGSPRISGGIEIHQFTLTSAGDGLIVFQDDNPDTSNPARYITAADNSGEGFGGQTTAGRSELPPGLTVGLNAIAFPNDPTESDNEYDNVYYNCSLTTGTPAQISGAVNDVSRWTLTNSNSDLFASCSFVCQAVCSDPVLTSLNASPASSCPGTPVTLSVSGSLNDASQWELRTGSCTGPIVQTTTSNTFPSQVNPDLTTTYFVTVANCANQSVCGQGTVTRNVAGADAGSDIRTNGTSANLSANTPTGGSSGQWTIVNGDGNGILAAPTAPSSGFSGTAGQSYVLRWTISGGGCPNSTDDVEVSFLSGSTLTVGDVAFTGFNSGQGQAISYSLVLLRDVNAGTQINITDKGWLGTSFRTGENISVFTADRNYACGSEITFLQDFLGGPYRSEDADGRDAGDYVPLDQFPPSLNNGDDQLFAFQGTEANPTFLAGVDLTANGWDASPGDNFRDSALPGVLASNGAAVALGSGLDDGKYNCSVTEAIPGVLRAAINNPANWNNSNSGYDLLSFCGISCDNCIDPVLSGVQQVSGASSCPGTEVTLMIDGDLNSATAWRLHEGSVNNPVLETTTTNTFTVNPPGTTTYVVSVLNCDNSVASVSEDIIRLAETANITLDKPVTKVTGTTVMLTGNTPTGGQTATWTLVSGTDANGSVSGNTLTGTAGQAYTVRYTFSGGTSCPATTDETTVSFLADGTMLLGDMMFTGYNSQGISEFSLVVLEAQPAGQVFSVTDNGWFNAGGLGNTENTINYSLCLPLNCGDEVIFTNDGRGRLDDGTVVVERSAGDFPAINSVGDQLFLYNGITPPTAADQSAFVAAIQMNCENGNCSVANWDGDRFDNTSSAKPGVFNGTTAFMYANQTNPPGNARFNCATSVGNGKTMALAALNDPANWDFRENPTYDLTSTCGTFSCCTPGTISSVSSDVNNVCPGNEVIISFTGMLNESNEWLVSSGSCNGTFVTTLGSSGTADGAAFSVNPIATTTYYIRAEGLGGTGCAASDCASITITVTNSVTAMCKPTYTVEIGADGNAIFTAADLDGGSTSACGTPLNFSVDPSETFACANIIDVPRTVTLTVTDESGATDNCTSSVEVEDNVAPTFDCTDITVTLGTDGTYFITADDILNRMVQNWNDNCAPEPANIGSGTRTITCNNINNGVFSYFFGALDGNGQEATCVSMVTVLDPTLLCDDAPTAICLATAVVQIDENGNPDASSIDNGSSDDNTAAGDLIFSIQGDVLGCDDVGMSDQTIILVVTDNVGQTATCTSQVTVEDNIAPTGSCQNVVFALDGNGQFNPSGASDPFLAYILTSFNDNCANEPFPSIGASQGAFGCADIGINDELYGFYDRTLLDPNRREFICRPRIQITDPLGVCGSDPVANCQDVTAFHNFEFEPFRIRAGAFDNGSTDDRSVYALVFDPSTNRQESLTDDCTFVNEGQGMSFTAGMTGMIQTIRVRSVANTNTTIHLYAGNNGSGVLNSVGTPAYSQAVELFASPEGALTEILLNTPFPVFAGQEYSFLFEGENNLYYACPGSPAYTGGRAIEDYVGFVNFNEQSYVFQVDIIGSDEFAVNGPISDLLDIYAVDDQGNVSAACTATLTVNDACTFSAFTSAPFGDNSPYCPNQDRTLSISADLAPGAEIVWYLGGCDNQTTELGRGESMTTQLPASTVPITVSVQIETPDGCPAGPCIPIGFTPESEDPTVGTRNISKGLEADGTMMITPEEVFDAATSSDNCDPSGIVAATDVTPVSVTPNTFTIADLGPNIVTLTARDLNGNTSTGTAIVTVTLGALPVSWLSFGANAGAKQVDLHWETTLEPDNAGFDVQRSSDALNWQSMGNVTARPTPDQTYTFTDNDPLEGNSYYRIKQMDYDGTTTYSEVRNVWFTAKQDDISIYPNPATDRVEVRLPEGASLTGLFDPTGRRMSISVTPQDGGIHLNTTTLPAGIYLLDVSLANGSRRSRRLVIR